jgi:hypothetical protein
MNRTILIFFNLLRRIAQEKKYSRLSFHRDFKETSSRIQLDLDISFN